jgi:hypothetical protein
VHSVVGQNKDGSRSQSKEAPPSQEEPVAPPLPMKKEKPPVPPKKPARPQLQVRNRVVTIINMNDIWYFISYITVQSVLYIAYLINSAFLNILIMKANEMHYFSNLF